MLLLCLCVSVLHSIVECESTNWQHGTLNTELVCVPVFGVSAFLCVLLLALMLPPSHCRKLVARLLNTPW